jgi:uncharacterized protein YggU (UPF0235/DUF167 family)
LLIHIKVETEQKKEEVTKLPNGGYEMRLKEKAERNEANRRVLEILREEHPEARIVRIIAGHHSPSKIVEIA